MNFGCERPIGDATTILDICDRDDQDDFMFPLSTQESWFYRNGNRRTLPFSPNVQEFAFRGPAQWGNTLQFEIGKEKTCDLLFAVGFQIKLGHWFNPLVQQNLKDGTYVYVNPEDAWFYANSLGTILIEKAEFCLEDQTLEVSTSDFSNLFSIVFPDQNEQYGLAADALGRVSIPRLKETPPSRCFPTEGGWISCFLPFSFLREKLRCSFPLCSLKEGSARFQITLRPFEQCVRIASGVLPVENPTPLNRTFSFLDTTTDSVVEVKTSAIPPAFQSVRFVTYGVVLDGALRSAYLHTPFDRLYRPVQSWTFDEPAKLSATVSSADTLQITLPLELNGPVEEILWFVRRKAVARNNEWTNYSAVLESEYNAVYNPLRPLMKNGTLLINGVPVVEEDELYFRSHIGRYHKGGIVPYRTFVYGYSFALRPGTHDPSGWFNASRTTDIRLRLTIQPPGGVQDYDWEVGVYAISLNWVRFQNGIGNRVYSC